MTADRQETIAYLKTFDCLKGRIEISPEEKVKVRASIQAIQAQSDYQILGILADTYDEAIAALAAFASALGHPIPAPPTPSPAPIYLKYNPASQLCYCDTYTGEHRGVLISFQSDFEDGINDMFGHFPLDLYAEE